MIRKSVSLRASVWRAVEEYRDREAVVTIADALRRLLQAGLRSERRKAEK